MLQEMRMVLRAHRVPGMDDKVPTPAQVFRMATSGGAATTPFADTIGALEVGRAADMVLIVDARLIDPDPKRRRQVADSLFD
jgi:cytosine/adenosine deaminase-related metal-dependent hydrolase